MKNLFYFSVGTLLFGFITLCRAQTVQSPVTMPVPTPPAIVARDANSRVWQWIEYQRGPNGQPVPRAHQFTELASGLCYQQNGQWVDSQEKINILPDGTAAATEGQYQVFFPANIYNGVIKMIASDGVLLQSQPIALSYDDGTNIALIAVLTNSVGELVNSNEVIYPNAFVGVDADLHYTYHKGGFEQDVILRAKPPTPESLGLNPQTVRLQALTEFIDPPNPAVSSTTLQTDAGSQVDENLDFGLTKMVPGKAFLLGTNQPDTRVTKQWFSLNGRQILAESVPVVSTADSLNSLPPQTSLTSLKPSLHKSLKALALPQPRWARAATNAMFLSATKLRSKGFVLDYVTASGGLTNYVFRGDSTYYISGSLNLYGTNIFEGGTVLKYAGGASVNMAFGFTPSPAIIWPTTPYNPVIFTARNDNTVGETIPGSASTYLANPVLSMWPSSPNLTIALSNFRMEYFQTGIYIDGGDQSITITNAQFVKGLSCAINMQDTGTKLRIENALIANVNNNAITCEALSVIAQNVTFANVPYLLSPQTPAGSSSFFCTNCIFANIIQLYNGSSPGPSTGAFNGFYKCANIGSGAITNQFNPFQIVGAGSFYLTNGCDFHAAGTNNIDPALLGQLASKTTYPPTVFSNVTISASTNFIPWVPRDTNSSPDLGYHYDPLDYVFGGCNYSTNISFGPGVAVGWFQATGSALSSPYAIALTNKANVSFNGNATEPDIIAHYLMVQEGTNGVWTNSGLGGIVINGSGGALQPQLFADFTKWIADARINVFTGNSAFGLANFWNSEFYNAGLSYYLPDASFTNCLFFRDSTAFNDQYANAGFNLQNCTFYNGGLSMARTNSFPASSWTIENSAFDGTDFSWYDASNGNSSCTLFNYNAYNTNNASWMTYTNLNVFTNGTLEVRGPNDTNVDGYNWQSSWFGNFYLPANSPILQKGSTTADQLGLYYFTTQTNQTPQMTSTVDIGYHYVATDANGNPLNEFNFGLTSQTVLTGSNALFSVSAPSSCGGPFTYQWQHGGTNIFSYITTIGGSNAIGGTYSGNGGPAVLAGLKNPNGMVIGPASGNIYFADEGNNAVREVLTNGIIITVAGRGSGGGSDGLGDGGPATNAIFGGYPCSVAVDSLGDLFIADPTRNRIREVKTNGIIVSVAGNGTAGFSGDGGLATSAELNNPDGVAVDGQGNIYISDQNNNRIRKVDTSGNITTFAGNGSQGYTGFGVAATNATFSWAITFLAVDIYGDLFIADSANNVIREVNTNGIITTVTGNGTAGYSGNGGLATNAELNSPSGITVDLFGNLYICDPGNNVIREVNASGIITTVAGTGTSGYSGDGGLAVNARLKTPNGLTSDTLGNLYFTDDGNNVIRQVNNMFMQDGALVLPDVTPNEQGTYDVIISSPCGSVTNSANLTVIIPLQITSQPSSQLVPQGQNATFSVAVDSIAPAGFQWLLNGTNIPGATSSSYTVLVAQPSQDGSVYSVVITNQYAMVTSSNAILGVVTPVNIITNGPPIQTVAQGSSASFGVATSGNYLTYQWYANGTPLINGPRISGTTNNILTISGATNSDAGNYYVVITNLFNSTASSTMTLTVVAPPDFATNLLPSENIIQSEDLTLTFDITNPPPLFFEWYFSNSIVNTNIESGSNPSYTQLVVQTNNAGLYSVTVTNLAGSTNGSSFVTVLVPPWITQQPMSIFANAGTTVTFTNSAFGTTNLGYQWLENGTNITGATNVTLTLTNILMSNAGGYSVVVSNIAGTSMSAWAWLSVISGGATNFGWGTNSFAPDPSPVVSMIWPTNASPSNPYPWPYNNPISIRALATNQYSYVTNVNFYFATNLVPGTNFIFAGTAVPGPDGIFALAWSNAVPGTNVLEARAFNCNGSNSVSSPVYVLMTQTPSVSAGPGTNLLWIEGTTTTNVPLFGAISSDGQPPNVTNIFWSGSGPAPVNFTNAGSLNPQAIFSTNGSYTITLLVSNGYVGGSATCTVNIKRRPTVFLSSPTNTGVYPYNFPLVLDATAMAYSGALISSVTFQTNYSSVAAAIQSIMNSWTYAWENATLGSNIITAVAVDSGGLQSTSAPITVNMISLVPDVQIFSPINQTFWSRTNTLIIATNVLTTATIPITSVQIFDNGFPIGYAVPASSNFSYQLSWLPVTNGAHVLTALAVGSDGSNFLSAPVTNFVKSLPTVRITSPANGQAFTNPPVNITVTASAAVGQIGTSIASVTYYQGTNVVGSSSSGPNYIITWNPAASGIYALSARVSDNLGAVGTSSNVVITVEAANQPPFVYPGPNQTNFYTTAAIPLNGRVSDDGLPNGQLTITWTNVGGQAGVTFVNSNSPVTGVNLPGAGTYLLQLWAYDGQYTTRSNATIVMLAENQPPTVNPGTNQTFILPALSTNLIPSLNIATLIPFQSDVAGGIDYFPASNCVIESFEQQLPGFELIHGDGSTTAFAPSIGYFDEDVTIAAVRDTLGGFKVGEMFTPNGADGCIMRIEPDGTAVGTNVWTGVDTSDNPIAESNAWMNLNNLISLTNSDGSTNAGLLRGGLWVDRTGVWGGDLLVSTTEGNVFRINSAGQVRLVAQLSNGTSYEGLTTVPNDVPKYGPWAGRLLVGDDQPGSFYAVDTNGVVVQYNFPFGANSIRVIPENENFYGRDYNGQVDDNDGGVYGAPASAFQGMAGDILIADEDTGNSEDAGYLYRAHWNGSNFDIYPVWTRDGQGGFNWEQICFAPAGVTNQALPASLVQLNGVVTDDGELFSPTSNLWTMVSGPTPADFVNPFLTNTMVNLSVPGTYVLQFSAFDGEYTTSSNVTITVIQNQAPYVNAGTNQFISSGSTTLQGVVTNLVFPPPYNQIHTQWKEVSGPPGAPNVTFSPNALATNAGVSFPTPGSYLLLLTADDGQATNVAEVVINYLAPYNLFVTPGYLVTPTNTPVTITARLVDAGNNPITNKEVDVQLLNVSVNYNSYGFPATPPPAWFTNMTDAHGNVSFIYTNLATSLGYDVVMIEGTNFPGVTALATNFWAQPMECGDIDMHQSANNGTAVSIDPWVDGVHYAGYYAFNDHAGDTIQIGLQNIAKVITLDPPGNSDPLVAVLRNSSYQIVAVSPATQSINSQYSSVLNYTIPTNGTYLLEVTPVVAGPTASYNVSLTCDDELVPNMQVLFNGTNVPSGGTVVFPQTVQGSPTNIALVITNAGGAAFDITNVIEIGDFQVTNNILATVLPNGSTNAGTVFHATSGGLSSGSLVLSADYPGATTYIIYFMANTAPTGAVQTIQLTSPLNGSIFLNNGNANLPFTAVANPAVPGNESVQVGPVTTNGISLSNTQGQQWLLQPAGDFFTWTNTFQSSGQGDFDYAVAIRDGGGNIVAQSTPVLIHVQPYYSTDPSQSSQIQVIASGTNVPSGGTIVFPQTLPGVATNVTVVITNSGNYPLGISVGLQGDFTLTNDLVGATVLPGASTNFQITFNASSSGVGLGYLLVTNNASIGGEYIASLAGSALPVGYVPPGPALPVATNEQFTILANSIGNTFSPLSLDRLFDTNALTIVAVDTSTTAGTVSIIDDGAAITYSPPPGFRSETVGGVTLPADGFYYEISDPNGNTAWGTVSIIIYATDTPDVVLSAASTSVAAGTSDPLTASLLTSTNIVAVNFYLGNTEIGTVTTPSSGTNYVLSWTAIDDLDSASGDILQASAMDRFGQVGVAQPITVNVQPPAGAVPPAAVLDTYTGLNDANGAQSLTNFVTIRDGVFSVYGRAYEPSASNFGWQLAVYSADGTTFIRTLATNNDQVGSSTTSNLLATCDLSTLQNGVYLLALIVTGNDMQKEYDVQFTLESNVKIGQFSFSQQDLIIPVNGIPLAVTRTYNSINPDKGDFGFGWTYALSDMDVTFDETRENVVDLDGDVFSQRTGGGRDVTLTLPNGQRTTFYYQPQPLGGLGDYTPTWIAAPGVTAQLLPGPDSATVENVLLGTAYWQDPDTGTGVPDAVYDFPDFILKTLNGTKYLITRQDSDTHDMSDGGPDGYTVHAWGDPSLSTITDLNTNTITITPSSITSTALNGATRQIVFQRSNDGLITAISDPNGLLNGVTNGPPAMVYQYDNNDNLIGVQQLTDSSGSGTYVTNTFAYTNAAFSHYITDIINANGTQVAKNFYNDDGQLIAVQDANGNLTQFIHNLTNSMEIVIDRNGNTNTSVYDSRGNITVETNALGQVMTMAYDNNNNKTNEVTYLPNGTPYATSSSLYSPENLLLSSTDPLGNTNGYTYNQFGEPQTSSDARGNTSVNGYDSNGNLISTADPLGHGTTNSYGSGFLMGSVDAIGTATTNSYDSATGYLTHSATLDASGDILSSNSYAYDSNGNRLTSTVWRLVNGSWEADTTTNIYDAMNRVTQTINPDGGTNTTIYNATGQQQATVDALGNVTSYTYDNENRLVRTTYPDGTTTSSAYDANGNRVTSTDQESRVTQYQYDPLNRLTNTIYPDNITSATIYDAFGRVAQTIDARGTITANAYDVAGRRIAVTNAFGTSVQAVSVNSYDPNGNQVTFTDANGHSTTNIYDALNRQVEVEYAGGTKSFTVYDAAGRTVAQTNQDNIGTWFSYDGAGRLIAVTNALQQVAQYQYDEAGNEIQQIDALSRINTFTYDGMNRKVSHTLPFNPNLYGGHVQTEGFDYDLNGNQIAYTNFSPDNGKIVFSQYDSMNRLTNCYDTDNNSGFSAAYTYTPTGQRASELDYGGYAATSYRYDSRDRLVQKIVSWNYGFQLSAGLNYGYDADGNVTNITSGNANGVNLAYIYDPLNRLTNVLSRGQLAATYAYDLAGNMKGMRYGNGVTNQYQYDSLNRLTNLVWNYGNSSRASFAYALMAGGTRTDLTESIQSSSPISESWQWSYDNLYRLTNESNSALGGISYAYDAVGNRTNRTSSGSVMSAQLPTDNYSYDTNDEIMADDLGIYSHDIFEFDGNTTIISTNSYTYDWLSRMSQATVANVSLNFFYDGDGNRILKRVNGVITAYYLVDDNNPSGFPQVLEEYQTPTNEYGGSLPPVLTHVYNYGLGLISQQQFDPNTLLPSVLSYYGYDGHGNVRFLMDTNGTITDTYTYDAFGSLVSQWYGGSSATPNNYLYCGQQFDWDLGLYYNRARYLCNDIGRFMSRDGDYGNNEDPLSLHKYLYAQDDPVDNTDPTGHALYQWDSQKFHVFSEDNKGELMYIVELDNDGKVVLKPKPGHVGLFDEARAKANYAKLVRDPKELQKMRDVVRDAWRNGGYSKAGRDNIARFGINLRHFKGGIVISSLCIIGWGLALDPGNADAVQSLNGAMSKIRRDWDSGTPLNDDDINDATVAIHDIYNNDDAALWWWYKMEELEEDQSMNNLINSVPASAGFDFGSGGIDDIMPTGF
jgi:RHS repeat-associated protein